MERNFLTWLIICNLSNTPIPRTRMCRGSEKFSLDDKTMFVDERTEAYSIVLKLNLAEFAPAILSRYSSIIFQFVFNQKNFSKLALSGLRSANTESISSTAEERKKIWCWKFFTGNRINYNLVCLHSIKSFCVQTICRAEEVKRQANSLFNLDYFTFLVSKLSTIFLMLDSLLSKEKLIKNVDNKQHCGAGRVTFNTYD